MLGTGWMGNNNMTRSTTRRKCDDDIEVDVRSDEEGYNSK